MKQQFVVTQRYTIVQETENTWTILNRPALKSTLRFYENTWTSNFFFFFADSTFWNWSCVCNPAVYWCGNLSWKNCGGDHKLLFHKRHGDKHSACKWNGYFFCGRKRHVQCRCVINHILYIFINNFVILEIVRSLGTPNNGKNTYTAHFTKSYKHSSV